MVLLLDQVVSGSAHVEASSVEFAIYTGATFRATGFESQRRDLPYER